MKGIVVYIFVLAFLTIGQAGANEQSNHGKSRQICVPGSMSREACNTCTCTLDGMALACTKMMCPTIPVEYLNPDGSIRLPHQRNPLLRNKREYLNRVQFEK